MGNGSVFCHSRKNLLYLPYFPMAESHTFFRFTLYKQAFPWYNKTSKQKGYIPHDEF